MRKIFGIITGIIGILLICCGTVLKMKGHVSMVVGGADGPTSVFIAGKLGGTSAVTVIGIGVLAFVCGIFLIKKKEKR